MTVSTGQGLFVGRKSYNDTLALRPREVVLTFDDGPMPGATEKVLEALARECVRATFFLIGRNARAAPHLARRIAAEGHTVAHHTMNHIMTIDKLPFERALAEIEDGFRTVEEAAFGRYRGMPASPFFRYPGFGDSAALNARLAARGIGVFGADVWASDWNDMAPDVQLRLVMGRIEHNGGGIVLLHDPRPQTVAMVPAFLRALKARGFKVVHIVPGG
jgi:peptidoglycan/xylan/chitin deacetylase (PgdA/CDA1 family)